MKEINVQILLSLIPRDLLFSFVFVYAIEIFPDIFFNQKVQKGNEGAKRKKFFSIDIKICIFNKINSVFDTTVV